MHWWVSALYTCIVSFGPRSYAQLTVINSWFPEQFSFGIIVFVDEDVALN